MFNRFRITGYYPEKDFCFILDSSGLYEKMAIQFISNTKRN